MANVSSTYVDGSRDYILCLSLANRFFHSPCYSASRNVRLTARTTPDSWTTIAETLRLSDYQVLNIAFENEILFNVMRRRIVKVKVAFFYWQL